MGKQDKKASIYTVLYWSIHDKKIDPELLINLIDFYWPKFIIKGQYVFLEQKFSEEEYQQLINESENPEYWINLLTIDDFFSEITNGAEKSMILIKTLVEIWTTKLKKDFPSMNFIVESLQDEEYGDCGLTFYQNNF